MIAMIIRLAICAALVLAEASGEILQYQVDFSSNTLTTTCFIICPASPLPPGMSDAWVGTFDLNSTDLATNGTYDVTSSFRSIRTFTDSTILTDFTSSGTVDAVVSGGAVTGFESDYMVSYDIVPNNGDTNYRATLDALSTGFFRLDWTATLVASPTVAAEDGDYSIGTPTPVPEPASLGWTSAITAMTVAFGSRRRIVDLTK
jgi:hypothetical protein